MGRVHSGRKYGNTVCAKFAGSVEVDTHARACNERDFPYLPSMLGLVQRPKAIGLQLTAHTRLLE